MSKRLALLIGNSEFVDGRLSKLCAPDADVADLGAVLKAPSIGAFDDVTTLTNPDSMAARIAIARLFARKAPGDLLLLFFSGHGVRDENGALFLAVRDTDHDLLSATAVPAAYITAEMDRSRSRSQVLILDCCHSGAFSHGMKASVNAPVGTGPAFQGNGFGRVVLTASDATQFAWDGDRVVGEAGNSVFSRFLIQGLRSGEADVDADGRITVDELFDYVSGKVAGATSLQTPGKWTYKQQGDILLARNPSPHVTPANPRAPFPSPVRTPPVAGRSESTDDTPAAPAWFRRHRAAWVGGLIAIVAVVVLLIWFLRPDPIRGVVLDFADVPVPVEEMSITVDGQKVASEGSGRNALRIVGLQAGIRAVEVVYPDYETWRQAVAVPEKSMASFRVTLQPKPATLALTVNGPAEYTLWVDGRLTPVQKGSVSLPPGKEMALVVRAVGFKDATRTLTTFPNRTTAWSVTLDRVPEQGVLLDFADQAIPLEEMRITVDSQGVTPQRDNSGKWRVGRLKAGDRNVEIWHADFEPWQQSVAVPEASMVPVRVSLQPKPATLALTVNGPAAYTLLVDGRETSVQNGMARLPPGKATTLVVKANGFEDATFTLTPSRNGKMTREVTLKKIAEIPLPPTRLMIQPIVQ